MVCPQGMLSMIGSLAIATESVRIGQASPKPNGKIPRRHAVSRVENFWFENFERCHPKGAILSGSRMHKPCILWGKPCWICQGKQKLHSSQPPPQFFGLATKKCVFVCQVRSKQIQDNKLVKEKGAVAVVGQVRTGRMTNDHDNFHGVFEEEPHSPGADFAAEASASDQLSTSPDLSRMSTLDHKFPGGSPLRYGPHTVTPPSTTTMWGGTQPMLDSSAPPPGDKPTRPLSAYNFFFQLERQRIINSPESDRDKDVRYTVEDVARVAKLQLEKIKTKKPKEKRSHRKTHGKISFGDLARTIAAKWKRLEASAKEIFEKSASVEKERYRLELGEWNKKQKKWKEVTSRMTSTLHQHHRFFASNNVTPTPEPKKTVTERNGDLETLMQQQARLLQDSGFMTEHPDLSNRLGRSGLDSHKNSPSNAFNDRLVMGSPFASPHTEQKLFGSGNEYDDASFAAQQQLHYQQRMWWAEQQRQAQLQSSREQSESALLMRHQMMMLRQGAGHPYGYDHQHIQQHHLHNNQGTNQDSGYNGFFDEGRRSDHQDLHAKQQAEVNDNFDFGDHDHAGDLLGNAFDV